MLVSKLGKFTSDQSGGIAIISAFALPAVLGISCLAVEYGHGLLVRGQNQRTADLAAYAAALTYNDTNSDSSMLAAAKSIAAINGVAQDAVTARIVESPRGNGNQAITVSIVTQSQILLGAALGWQKEVAIAAVSFAEMPVSAPACIIALSGQETGITLSGGTNLSAPSCGIASNSTVTAPCGTTIKTASLTYDANAAPSQPCAGIQNPTGGPAKITRVVTADPIANSSALSQAVARLTTVQAMMAPRSPSVANGPDINFAYQVAATQNQAIQAGCTASFASPVWTLTCPPLPSYSFGSISMGGGITVRFNTTGAANALYNFSGSITNTGTLSFGPGTYKIAKGLYTTGGSTTTFGAGEFQIGQGTAGCNGSVKYSICHQGTALSFGGPSRFRLASGLFVSGGASLTLGSGISNSFEIGAGTAGDALVLSGGSNVTLGDATASDSVFRIAGNINVTSGGGSCLTLGPAAQHDIRGNLATAGGTVLGAGIYTVTGFAGLGLNGGGDVRCNGATVGLRASDVTFVLGGSQLPASGTCTGQAYCVAAGYSTVSTTAPSVGPTAQFLAIGPQAASARAGALFAEGANTSLSGVFYFPNGPVALTGGASVGNGSGQCLQIIASRISLSGGTAAGSTCAGIGSSAGNRSIVLVQ